MQHKVFIATAMVFSLIACSATTNNLSNNQQTTVVGDYASDGYAKRENGYDWVMVSVTAAEASDSININIHSREDIKKPTCSLKTKATATSANHYLAQVGDSQIVFEFVDEKLSVFAGQNSDRYDLMYFCSGGGSIGGDYQRL